MDTLQLTIVTPQRQVLDAAVRWVDVPASSGELRALPDHAPTLGALGAGTVRYEAAGQPGEQTVAVRGGFFEVLADKVTLLADAAGSDAAAAS
ncbi:MAG: ATP synthase F1 subunit epsilon [Terriglobales bacterium]